MTCKYLFFYVLYHVKEKKIMETEFSDKTILKESQSLGFAAKKLKVRA